MQDRATERDENDRVFSDSVDRLQAMALEVQGLQRSDGIKLSESELREVEETKRLIKHRFQ